MKVLLVNPRMIAGWRPYMIWPIGLCSLKASVEKALPDCKVKVLDAGGLSEKLIERTIREWNPNIVGVTSFTEARWNSLRVLEIAREVSQSIVTVMGGIHASHCSNQVLNHKWDVDAVCIGEGERALREWIQADTQPGGFLAETIRNLDNLPFPDISDLDLGKYREIEGPYKGEPLAAICTSRGCAYNCLYCASKAIWGNIRYRSVPNVIEEMEYLVHRHNLKNYSIIDDIFTLNRKRVVEFCESLLHKDLDIRWRIQTRTDCVDLELLKLMKKAGCRFIAYGVESGSPAILENLNKKEDVGRVRQAFHWSKEADIETAFNVIVGSPGETRQTLEETRQVIKDCRPTHIATAALRAYPGTALWELGKKEGIYNNNLVESDQITFFYTSAMSVPEMYQEIKKFVFLQASLQGFKGWIELIKLGIRTLFSQPKRIIMGVLGG